jgi:hypothetical protein
MDPASVALIASVIREGIPAIIQIAGIFRREGRPDIADAIEDSLKRSDATLDDVIATARREQKR